MNLETQSPAKMKILVIDDDIFITEILKGIAEKLGCDVKCVHDGKDVGVALVAYEPQVIFLDLVLPGVDGVEIIQVLAKVGSKAKIVLMSGLDRRTLSSVREVARAHRLEITEAVSKPFAPGQVEQILTPIIESNQQNQQIPAADPSYSRFGPRVLFEPELILSEDEEEELSWVRAKLIWQTDDHQSIEMQNLFDPSNNSRTSKGLAELLLQQTREESNLLQSENRTIGIKMAIDSYLLEDSTTPDYLNRIVESLGLKNSQIMFEICESSVLNGSERAFDVMTRLKIKGFKLAVCVKDKNDQVLGILNKLPIDEIVIDMAGNNFKRSNLEDAETEFQIGSLVSYATGADLMTSGKNILNEQQFSFARRCKLSKLSGRNIREPDDSIAISNFLKQTEMEPPRESIN